jgi:hypothetical protein
MNPSQDNSIHTCLNEADRERLRSYVHAPEYKDRPKTPLTTRTSLVLSPRTQLLSDLHGPESLGIRLKHSRMVVSGSDLESVSGKETYSETSPHHLQLKILI